MSDTEMGDSPSFFRQHIFADGKIKIVQRDKRVSLEWINPTVGEASKQWEIMVARIEDGYLSIEFGKNEEEETAAD